MRTLSLTLTLVMILTMPTVAMAKGIILLKGTKIEGKTLDDQKEETVLQLELDATRFLIERDDIDHYNLVEKKLLNCEGDLSKCQTTACECKPVEKPGFLDSIGLPGIVTGVVVLAAALFVGGVVVGAKAVK